MPMPGLFAAVGELVLPRSCAGCRRPGTALCPDCRPWHPAPTDALRAAASTVAASTVAVDGIRVCAAGRYSDGLRTALIAYKERGRHDLARPLGELLADAVRAVGAGAPDPAFLVPIPSSARASRERGGDHLLALARVAGRASGLPMVRALRLARRVSDSAGLGRDARTANLAGAFVATRTPDGRWPILLDDIVTTGATLREASRALVLAGWPVPVAAVVAATPRLVPARPARRAETSGEAPTRRLPWG